MKYHFECTKCGNCCRRPGVIELADDEMRRIAQYLEVTPYDLTMTYDVQLRDGAWWLRVEEGQSCVFLKDDRCSIQEVKPVQCRTYPFWPEIVLEKDAWEQEKSACPGIGRGRGYPSKEIESILNHGAPTED